MGSGKWDWEMWKCSEKLGFVQFPFLMFGCNVSVSEKIYCVFWCLVSNVKAEVRKLTKIILN